MLGDLGQLRSTGQADGYKNMTTYLTCAELNDYFLEVLTSSDLGL